MTVGPKGDHVAELDRRQAARRLLDDTQRMLTMALRHPEMVELIDLLERARDEAERVYRATLHPQ